MANRIDSSSSSSSNYNSANKEAPTLLEHLRNPPGETSHAAEWSDETCTQLRRRVLEHQSEFPSVIRRKIEWIARDDEPQQQGSIAFMERLNDSVRYFLTPPRYLDSDVDTEEELEVAIRLFPTSLEAADPRRRVRNRCPIGMSMHYVNKRPFVPLFVELGHELGVFGEHEHEHEQERRKEHHTETETDAWPFEELFSDREMYDLGQNREEYHRQLDRTSLSVMVRLKERGFLVEHHVQKNIRLILCSEHARTKERFRYLLHWIPSLLEVTPSHHPLLSDYLEHWNPPIQPNERALGPIPVSARTRNLVVSQGDWIFVP